MAREAQIARGANAHDRGLIVNPAADANIGRELRSGQADQLGKILVVDDEEKIREALRRLLEADGHEVLEASNGRQALDLIAAKHPQIVLLDLLMPVLDGLQVLRALRLTEFAKNLPVIMISVLDKPYERNAASDLNVVDYIGKPWMAGEIELRVKWALKSGGRVPAVPWQLSGAGARPSSSLPRGSAAKLTRGPIASAELKPPGSRPGAGVEIVTPAEGGTVETRDGTVRVKVPAGAVRNMMALDAAPASEDEPPGHATLRLKQGRTVADLTFTDRTGTHIEGVRLDQPASISFKYSKDDVAEAGSEKDVTIQKYDTRTGRWRGLPTSINSEDQTATIRTRRFPKPARSRDARGKILVVEDEASARQLLIDAIEGSGFVVIEETSGASAGRRVLEEKPDVVFLATTLPGFDGFQALTQIKRNPASRATTVIMVGSSPGTDEFATSLRLGARDYVTKPLQHGDIQNRVKHAFDASLARKRQAERAVARARARVSKIQSATRAVEATPSRLRR